MRIRYPLFLGLFVLTLALAFLLRFLGNPFVGEAGDPYVRTVQARVQRELVVMDEKLADIQRAWESTPSPSFPDLFSPVRNPEGPTCFVYRDWQLVAWSDFRVVPDSAEIAGEYRVKLLSLRNGRFLVSKRAFVRDGHRIEACALQPLYLKYKVENTSLQSGFNQRIIPGNHQRIEAEPAASGRNVYAADGTFLFSLEGEAEPSAPRTLLNLSVLAGLLSVAFLGIYLRKWMNGLALHRNYEAAFVLLAAYLLATRAVMLTYNLPFSLVEFDLFNPKYYASSQTSPSLGDLLLNVLVIATLGIYLIRHYAKSRLYRRLVALPEFWQVALSAGIVLGSYSMLYLHFYVLRTIYLHSQFTLDITQSIDFPLFKILCLLVFVLNSGAYFMGMHVLCSVFIRLNPSRARALLSFGVGTITYALLYYFLDSYYSVILLLNASYLLLLYFLRLPRYLYRFRYVTTIYFFVAALVCATIGAFAIYNLEGNKQREDKARFGSQLLAENDVFGEFLLDEAARTIRRDPFIERVLQDPFGSKDKIVQKVKNYYLSSYFNRYDAEVTVFDAEGRNVASSSALPESVLTSDDNLPGKANYAGYARRYQKVTYKTSYPNLYFINELGGSVIKQYVYFIELGNRANGTSHLVIDLKQKQQVPLDVYPELLVENRFLPSAASRQYSYAIYSGTRLQYSTGNYNYEAGLPASVRRSPALFDQGVTRQGYQHLGIQGDDQRMIVVSSRGYPLTSLLANFSFLFLLLVLVIVHFVLAYAPKNRGSRTNTNFATKIQLYLNLAFFLPLFVVSVATVSIVNVAYRDSLSESFGRKAAGVSRNLRPYLGGFGKEQVPDSVLKRELSQIARYSDSDINVFTPQGKLILTSQPLIYDGLLSSYINPEAYVRVVEKREKEVMLPESVGTLHYNSAYVGVKSPEGRLLGIVSIPFFESKTELDAQIIEVVTTILNIFTAIFLFFLVLSYFATRLLTVPLRLITRKIQKTSLHDYNEPLEWDSDDEIGLLVGEYNRMLLKLEASKAALSQSEKESAWREMARQVAHEIKNPLTPMKLTLQHLRRTLPVDNGTPRRSTERAFNTLLEQIDTLSDIATSFSAFAKMPAPKNEVFEVTSVLKSATDLYANDADIVLDLEIPDQELFVVGDRQMMSGIFTNLLINGIQSVPADRQPHLRAVLSHREGHHVTIEVGDNGTGISEGIRSKVFLPNFSTKYAGSGIGLALAKRGVEHAGGRIWFETEEGVGTSFFVELPLARHWPTRQESAVEG
ncbi:MAG: HAMP domain-containing histidine kinase [Ferruginibacter sp.]|nr:HAMP domain-containing histidine kinase [Cytophagales bacterium]